MKKELNIIWIIFILLSAFIVLSSHFWMVRYVVTGYNGLPLTTTEDGESGWSDLNGGIITELPKPEPCSVIILTIFPAIFGAVVFLFKVKWLHIAQIIIELFETLLLMFSSKILNASLFQIVGCEIGGTIGHYEISLVGYLSIAVCLIVLYLSIMMTIGYQNEKS